MRKFIPLAAVILASLATITPAAAHTRKHHRRAATIQQATAAIEALYYTTPYSGVVSARDCQDVNGGRQRVCTLVAFGAPRYTLDNCVSSGATVSCHLVLFDAANAFPPLPSVAFDLTVVVSSTAITVTEN